MRYWIMLLLLSLGLAGGLYYRYQSTKDGPGAKESQPVPVTVAKVTTRDVPRWVEAVGRGEAFETVTVKSRVDGQVATVPYTEGRHVRRGELLVRLDTADFSARLRQAEANLARNQAQLAKARGDVDRYVALRESGFVSEEKVSEVRAGLQAAEAAVLADKAAADLARLQLGYADIHAPIDGIVGAKLVFPGAGVKTNETELAVINRVRPLHIGFTVPERHLPLLRAALRQGKLVAGIRAPGDVSAEGPVSFLDNAVDGTTGTIRLKATVDNADEAFAPGQFVQVRLTLDVWKGAATVPAEAVQQGPQGSYVFVVRADKGIEQRGVDVADSRDGLAVVTRGLREGEVVVTDGHLRLTAKSKVQVKPPDQTGARAN